MARSRNIVSCDFCLDEIEIGGKTYDVGGTLKGEVVNMGIGPFEFWGAKGNDVHMGIEKVDIDVDYIIHIYDDGETVDLSSDMLFKESISDYLNNNEQERFIEILEESMEHEGPDYYEHPDMD